MSRGARGEGAAASGTNGGTADARTRAKVWSMENGQWVDRGTGHCTCERAASGEGPARPRLVVRDDEDNAMVMDLLISPTIDYRRDQDKLIVWTEPTYGHDVALSFLENDDCSLVRSHIIAAQRELGRLPDPPVLDDDLSSVAGSHGHDGIRASMDLDTNPLTQEVNEEPPSAALVLPEPSMTSLATIEALTNAVLLANEQERVKFVTSIVRQRYVFLLLDLFDQAEDLDVTDALHTLFRTFRNLIVLNDPNILEEMFQKQLFLRVMGVLEYDPSTSGGRVHHRAFLEKENAFHEVVPLPSRDLAERIQKTFRLQYLRDVALPRTLEDGAFATINRTIQSSQIEIGVAIQRDEPFLKQLFGLATQPAADATKQVDAVLFLQEFCHMARGFPVIQRSEFFRIMTEHGFMDVIKSTLCHAEARMRTAAIEMLSSVLSFRPTLLRWYILDQHGMRKATGELSSGTETESTAPSLTPGSTTGAAAPANSMMASIIRRLQAEEDDGAKAQFADILRTVLDTDMPSDEPKTERDMILNLFYERFRYVHDLFEPVQALVPTAPGETLVLTPQQAGLLEQLLELSSAFVQRHSFRMKYYVLSNQLLQKALILVNCRPRHVALAALRFFRHVVGMRDDFYDRYIVNNGLFGPIMQLLEQVHDKNNLVNSAILELLNFVRIENVRILIEHIVLNYRALLERIDYVAVCRQLVAKYAQLADPSSASSNGATAQALAEAARRKRAREDRDLDKDEEVYFSHEDDDEDDGGESGHPIGPPVPATLSSPDGPTAGKRTLLDDDDLPLPGARTRRRDGSDHGAGGDGDDDDDDDDAGGGLRLRPRLTTSAVGAPGRGGRSGAVGFGRNTPTGRAASGAGVRPATPIRFVSSGLLAAATASPALSALAQYANDDDDGAERGASSTAATATVTPPPAATAAPESAVAATTSGS